MIGENKRVSLDVQQFTTEFKNRKSTETPLVSEENNSPNPDFSPTPPTPVEADETQRITTLLPKEPEEDISI